MRKRLSVPRHAQRCMSSQKTWATACVRSETACIATAVNTTSTWRSWRLQTSCLVAKARRRPMRHPVLSFWYNLMSSYTCKTLLTQSIASDCFTPGSGSEHRSTQRTSTGGQRKTTPSTVTTQLSTHTPQSCTRNTLYSEKTSPYSVQGR